MRYWRGRAAHPSVLVAALMALLAMGPACDLEDPPTYVVGMDLGALTFNLYTANMGIHPDRSVLADPTNIFASAALAGDTKWDILSFGGSVAAFYCWATVLTREPTGEAQYYTASAAREIYELGLTDTGALPFVRDMAIRGFQSVLDNFPNSVTYDASGNFYWRLAPLAYEAILAMGGSVQGDWVPITLPNGEVSVIPVDGPESDAEEAN